MEDSIYIAMNSIMQSIEAVKKSKTNEQQKFKYRGIDDVMNALHDSFAKAGVFVIPEVLDRMEVERATKDNRPLFYVTLRIKYTFFAGDGSNVSTIVSGTAMDSGDKADNKCMAIGLKYALLQTFLIPTEDMIDPDSQVHEPKPEDNKKPLISLAAWEKAIERMKKGEDLAEMLISTYELNDAQIQLLQQWKTH